jgi:flagellar motor switch protein FliG
MFTGHAAELSRPQKAAVVLCLLGRGAAQTVFESLDEEVVERFAAAMASLGHIDEATVAEVVAEFLDEIDSGEGTVRGGLETARALLGEHFDPPVVERIFRELQEGAGPAGGDVWARLARVDPEVLAGLLASEHAQSAAVVISRLPPEYAGRVASLMDAETVSRLCLAMARMRNVDARYVELIGDNVSQALVRGQKQGLGRKPPRQVAAIMDNTRGDLRDEVIGLIEAEDPDFAAATRRSMFTFEGLPDRLRPRDVAAVVRSVDSRTLLVALAGEDEATGTVRSFILSNISSRFAEQIGEEIRETESPQRRKRDEAEREIMKAVLRLEKAGEIQLIQQQD